MATGTLSSSPRWAPFIHAGEKMLDACSFGVPVECVGWISALDVSPLDVGVGTTFELYSVGVSVECE